MNDRLPVVRQSRVSGALEDLLGALVPDSVRQLQAELAEKLAKIPTRLNEYGYDRFGLHPDSSRQQMLPSAWLFRNYFRAGTFGIENVPRGRVLLIANHAGQLPFDAMMLGVAMLLDADPPRLARGMGEYWIPRIPFFSWAATRGGNLVGTPENCVGLLEAEECVMVFPEGVRGMNKTFDRAYELQRFGLGFLRLALDTGTPIVPVGIVGSEEQQPGLANLQGLGEALGMPAFPITATFPWFGPLGLLPLPVKYRIHFGEPLRFEGASSDEDEVIQAKVDRVREAIHELLERGRSEREGVFW